MKVKIGPYINWWDPYQLANLLTKIGVSKERCEKIGETLSNTKLMNICLWIYDKRSVKRKVVIDDYDIWNLYESLALIVLPALKKFKENLHGAPSIIEQFNQTSYYSNQSCFDFYSEDDELADDAGHQEWKIILDKIIWSFEQIQPDNDWESQFHSGVIDREFIPVLNDDKEPDYYQIIKGPNDTHHFDFEGYQKHYKQIVEGFELFGKYYMNLWD